MLQQRCLLNYHQYGISELDTQSNMVYNGIYSNALIFPTSPVIKTDFDDHKAAFSSAAADYLTFGFTKKTIFLEARKALINDLDQTADYVNTVAQGDPSIIMLAGYAPTAAEAHKNTPLEKIPVFTMVHTTVSGEIVIEIPAIVGQGSVTYSCFCSQGAPLSHPYLINGKLKLDASDPEVHGDVTKGRRKIFTGLIPGVLYYFYVYATNSVSVSPLSDARSIIVS
jgi:hypothetical protein